MTIDKEIPGQHYSIAYSTKGQQEMLNDLNFYKDEAKIVQICIGV